MNTSQGIDMQHKLIDINACIWVGASAGTGKTKALTDRFLSLLIQGVDVRTILCLTFTNAAAFEMKQRIFQRLQKLSQATPETLSQELTLLLGRDPSRQELDLAEKLFYELVDRLHLLNITTIHGFCFHLLQQFPHEAGIPLQCEIMDESEQARLTNHVFQEILNSSDFEILAALDALTQAISENQLKEILVTYIQFSIIKGRSNKASIMGENWPQEIRHYLNHLLGDHDGSLSLPIHIREEISKCLKDLSASHENLDVDLIHALSRITHADDELSHLIPIFLTAEGKPRKKLCSAKTLRAFPTIAERLDRVLGWVLEAQETQRLQKLITLNDALNSVTQKFLGKMEDEKAKRQALDYSDIIEKTLLLLSNPSYADWISYRLGYSFHHVLVDEAQDTSPLQWQLILRLIEDCFASDPTPKSIFVVGDIKQSIYSFQGAYAESFQYFYELLKEKSFIHKKTWWDLQLTHSYRTTQPLLDVIDTVFNALPQRFSNTDDPLRQTSARSTQGRHYGRICLYPLIKSDDPSLTSSEQLAQMLAEEIATDLKKGRWLENHHRLAQASDFLILVQQRGPLTSALYKWLHYYDVPVAPPDRIHLIDQMCVQDCLAFAKLMLNRQDQMSLAHVLVGPFFGFTLAKISEEHLAQDTDSLWDSLESLPQFEEALSRLNNWMQHSHNLTPAAFLSQLIREFESQFIQCYGTSSLDSLDGFLSRIHFLAKECYSLQSIIDHFELVASAPYKRLPSQGNDSVRVMTVHGAKGLQAPIVILADTHRGPETDHGFVLDDQDIHAKTLWIPKKDYQASCLRGAMEHFEKSVQEEYYRLLYVAMTRCEDELIICGIDSRRGSKISEHDHPLTWYEAIQKSLKVDQDKGDMEITNQLIPAFENQSKVYRSCDVSTQSSSRPTLFKDIVGSNPYEKLSLMLVSKEDPQDSSSSTHYGTLVHQLMHLLSTAEPEKRQTLAHFFCTQNQAISRQMCHKILGLFEDQNLHWIWAYDGENELEVIQANPGQEASLMRIDRLVKTPEKWVVIDYKTGNNSNAPISLQNEYHTQLRHYIKALQPLAPLPVEGALLWIQTGDLEWVSQ
jgi:ATP-dependent helicase/nuclease subunit A